MRACVAGQGHELEKLYVGHVMCAACMKAYGKKYVVWSAKVKEPAGEALA